MSNKRYIQDLTLAEQDEYMVIVGDYPHLVSAATDQTRNELINQLWERCMAAKQSSTNHIDTLTAKPVAKQDQAAALTAKPNHIDSLKAKLAATQHRLAALRAQLEQVAS